MESEAGLDDFIAEVDEDGSSANGEPSPRLVAQGQRHDSQKPEDLQERLLVEQLASRVPTAVQQILSYRRQEDSSDEASRVETFDSCRRDSCLPGEDATDLQKDFARVVARLQETATTQSPGLEVRAFLDLQGYNLSHVAEKCQPAPGSTQLMYMFYSRIYEKLIGKQRGVDVPLFAAINLEERTLGFRGILAWAQDFKLLPTRTGRRELERIFATVVAGSDSPRQRFESKISYSQFLDFVALCSDVGEPMDRSKLDGSRAHTNESRLERVRRIAKFLSLPNSKKVKVLLHDAYRDVHFWKLSDGADFEKEARAAEMRSRPQWRVEEVAPERQLDDLRDRAVRKYLEQFTWVPGQNTWEEFEGTFLDMGTHVVGGAAKRFRVVLINRQLSLARLKLEVVQGGPLRLPWRDTQLSPGQTVEVIIDVVPLMVGEWCGQLIATATWLNGSHREDVVIPTYMRVVQPQTCGTEAARELPRHAPRPFRPGSARRIKIDPTNTSCKQLRTPTPHTPTAYLSRPSSAASGIAGYNAGRPPRVPFSRPESSHSGVPASHTSSRVQRVCSLLPTMAPNVVGREQVHMAVGARTRSAHRPHSAPSPSPQRRSASAESRGSRVRCHSAGMQR